MHLKKKLGQHFLVDQNVINKLVRNISPNNNINNQIPIEYPFQNGQIPLQPPVQNNKIQYSQIPNYNYYPNVSYPIKLGD